MKKLLLILALALPAYTNGMDCFLVTSRKDTIKHTIKKSNYPLFLEKFTQKYDISGDVFDQEKSVVKLQSYKEDYKNQTSDAYKITQIPAQKLYRYADFAQTTYKNLLLYQQTNNTSNLNDNSPLLTGDQKRLILSGLVLSTIPTNPVTGILLSPLYLSFFGLGIYSTVNIVTEDEHNASKNSDHDDPVANARNIYEGLNQVIETKKNIMRITTNKDL